MTAFVDNYIHKHAKINATIRKIMRFVCSKSTLIKKLTLKLSDLPEISDFDVPEVYQIEGCYVHSLCAIMEFSQATTSLSCL